MTHPPVAETRQTLRFVLTGEVDRDAFAAFLDRLYDPEHGDPKPDGAEDATFGDFANMVLDYAEGEFARSGLRFHLATSATGDRNSGHPRTDR